MRGKEIADGKDGLKQGITPAYAGKSSLRSSAAHRKRDHPRLCGEKLKRQIESKQLKGSPPPMRGKV